VSLGSISAFQARMNSTFCAAGRAGAGGVFGLLLGVVAKSAFGMLIVGIAAFTYLFS
jgi:hypothetical protein